MLSDYIASKTNKHILFRFSKKNLYLLWPQQTDKIDNLLDMYIDDAIAALSHMCDTWSITSENIAEMNVRIWTHIKAAFEKTLNGLVVQEPKIEDRKFQSFDTKSEGLTQERNLDANFSKYMESWK